MIKRNAIAWLIAAASMAPLASHAGATAMDLRFFGLSTFGTDSAQQAYRVDGVDGFNNGDPYTGVNYTNNFGSTVAGGYFASSFTSGAETNGPAGDFAGQQYGVGGLSFRRGDATASTSNLTPTGYGSFSLALQTTVVGTNNANGLVARDSGFEVESVWNYAALQPGESVTMAINGTGGFNYTDRLQLRYSRSAVTGESLISFETQSRSGTPDSFTLTRTLLGSLAPAALYADLTDVDYIDFALTRAEPGGGNSNPGVEATVKFLDARADGSNDLVALGSYTFSTLGSTFLATGDAGRFSGVSMSAGWLEPMAAVPEPSSYALMALGVIGVIGVLAFRRRCGVVAASVA